MESIHLWGLELIRNIQRWESEHLTVIMKAVTFLGSEYAYILLLSLVFWCVDEKRGIRMALWVILSAWINIALKWLFKQPRPFHLDPSVGIGEESRYGLPSGHAQNSLVMWLIAASWGKRKIFYAAAIALTLLIGFSRLYLGVHFPTDLLGGWFIGGLVLLSYFILGPRLEALLMMGGLRARLIAAALAALLMNALHPEEISLGALILGITLGYGLMEKYLGFSAQRGLKGNKKKFLILALRLILGLCTAGLLYRFLTALIPQENSAYFRLIQFAAFVILGVWIYLGAPWLFIRLKLAAPKEP